MKKFLSVLFLLAAFACPLFGQATAGYHRTNQAIARGSSGVTAVIVPYASVYVTSSATGTLATIYSDPGLSVPILTGMVSADANGNYGYYIALNYCVNERISSPGAGNILITNVCANSSPASVTASVANIAGLRSYNGSATILNVIGYYSATLTSPPDGGGGVFVDQGAGASADDGGVTIYDTVTGHNWKRQIPNIGIINSAWFGVKADNSTDNAATIQAGWNYMCAQRAGAFQWSQGFIRFGSHLNYNCTFELFGTGRNQSGGTYGTNLIYTGTEGYAFSIDTDHSIYFWQGMSWHDFALSSTEASTTTWTNAIQFTNPNASQGLQATFYGLSFNNWTGAAFYWHVTPFSSPTSTVTAYISDGTGSAPGHVLCLTSGSVAPSQTVTGSGVPASTIVIQDLVSGIAEFPATCSGGGGGHPWLVTTSSNVSSESMPVGFDTAPYAQAVTMRDIFTSGIGQAIGTDPYAGPELNQFIVENWDQENAQTTTAGVSADFFDLGGFGGSVKVENFTYDGSTAASPTIFRVGPFASANIFPGLYVETGSPSFPLHNIVETAYGLASGASIPYAYLSGCTYCSAGSTFLAQPYGTTSQVTFGPGLVGTVGYVDSTKTPVAIVNGSGVLDKTSLGRTAVSFAGLRGQTTNNTQLMRMDSGHVAFVDVHGAWLDGLTQGIVTLASGPNLAEGMVTDAAEGRVFEIESNTNAATGLIYNFANIPPDLQGQQIVIAVRWKLRTSQSGFWSCPTIPGSSGTPMLIYAASNGAYGGFSCNQYSTNTWYTSYFIGQLPAGATSTQVQTTVGASSPSATGTQYYDVAAVYVDAGSYVPYTLGGGSPTQAITWIGSAAPTYGTYILNDTAINSAPTANGIVRWVNTSAGSPGTFTPISTNPVVTCGTTTTCANTAQTAPRTVWGTVSLSSGTPSTAVVTAMTAFTATTSFVCTGNDRTTPATSVSIVNTSTSSITITGPNTVTDSIGYVCVGN